LIELINLTRVYGSKTAVNHINCKLPGGHVYGLLGLNGAGKSTTMNMMTGCLAPTEGTVKVNGFDVCENPIRAKKCIGYLPEIPPLYADMTVCEYLTFVAQARGVRGDQIAQQVRQVMAMTEIEDKAARLTGVLSKGYKQRVGIASTMLGNPDIIILDEPTVGLDPAQILVIRDLVHKLGQTKTVIISSHILSEIAELCDHILILADGNLVYDGSLEDLAGNGQSLEESFLHLTGQSAPREAEERPAQYNDAPDTKILIEKEDDSQ